MHKVKVLVFKLINFNLKKKSQHLSHCFRENLRKSDGYIPVHNIKSKQKSSCSIFHSRHPAKTTKINRKQVFSIN